MKSTLLLILSFIFSNTHAQFAPLGAKWHYSSSDNGSAPSGATYKLFESEKDTVLAGVNCKKLKITHFKYNGDTIFPVPFFVYQSNDTVFYFNDVYSRFFPLYIFNVNVGDTLVYHTPYIPTNPADTNLYVRVDSVTKFISGSDTLKHIWTSSILNTVLFFDGGYIELLGCPNVMFHQAGFTFPEADGPMRCYEDSSIFIKKSSTNCDYRLTSGISAEKENSSISVYLNPNNQIVQLKTSENASIHYNLFDANGKRIIQGNFNFETAIDLSRNTDGIYYLQLSKENKIFRTEKLSLIH